ncbi:MAG: hypothetical protein AAFN74_12775, partial [Myxococcota bacterium]
NEAPPPPAVTPFEPMPAASALTKIKMILHGGAVTNEELTTVSQENGALNPEGLRTVIADWSATPEFQAKLQAFLELSLQQDEINPRQPYRDQLDQIGGNDNQINTQLLYPSLERSFVRTAWNIVQNGGDFRQVVTTRRWQVTTAILAALVYIDRTRNPVRFEFLEHLTEADYSDWRNVTFVQASSAEEVPQFANTAAFVRSLRTIGNNGTLNLRAPRVGFFSTPTFYESWETNEDNQFRVTTNQAVLAALDILFEAGDTTQHETLEGLNEDHSAPDSACYQCHRMLDPMRLQFQNVYSFRYRVLNEPRTQQPGFAFQGYVASPSTMDEFAQALVDHPRFPTAWVQKLCMWANSQRCLEDDPEFIRLATAFSQDWDFMALLTNLFSSPLITGAEITETHDDREFFVSIARTNHMCVALDTRIKEARADRCAAEREANPDANPAVCNERNNIGCNASGLIRSMSEVISADAYGRGSREFIQESLSGPFNSRAMTELCTQLASREVGNGNQTFRTNTVDASLNRMVRYVMGLPTDHPRYDAARAGLRRAYDIAAATPVCGDGNALDVVDDNVDAINCGFGMNATRAMYTAWIVACSSPELAGQGL